MDDFAVIFDLDGTLIDSLTDIALCANTVLKQFKLPTHDIKEYKKFVGGGAEVLIRNCTPKNTSEEMIHSLLKRFKEIYEDNLHSNTAPYEGIEELLEKLTLNNVKIGVLSNKPHEFTLKYIDKFFKKYNIHEPHGQKESVPKKPNPKAAIQIASSLKVPCSKVLFVGDTDVDMQTAKNADMIAIGVRWGFRSVEELLEHGADFIVEKPIDILDIIALKSN